MGQAVNWETVQGIWAFVDAKHMVGQRFDNASFQYYIKHWIFMVVNDIG